MTFRRYPLATASLLVAVSALAALFGFRGTAEGVDPPPAPPDFTTVFGPVQLDGQNISPAVQPIVAFVNGNSCGDSEEQTQVASDDPANAPDIGKTVYAISVFADGSGFGQSPGCGTSGDSIHFYLPALHRMANETATFDGVGFTRQELTLGPELQFRATVPVLAAD